MFSKAFECIFEDCGRISNPADGKVLMNVTTYGAIALVECYEGFYPETEHFTCTGQGNWSKIPKCLIKGIMITCAHSKCEQSIHFMLYLNNL